MIRPACPSRGFTLTELAVVLVIVALLIGGMMVPLSAQMDMRSNAETLGTLNDARDALVGFAASHGAAGKPYLPCPDTDGDGRENRTGSACTNQEGDLPWADLGIGRQDAWNQPLRYRVTLAFADSATGFQLTTAGNLEICTSAACTAKIASAIPAVILSKGRNGATAPADADELENLDGDNSFVQRTQATSAGGYDDLVTWLSPNILFNRMLAAGRLP